MPPNLGTPFDRVESRLTKWLSLLGSILLFALCASLPLFDEFSLKDFHAWLALYGCVFFGVLAVHAWRSIRKGWNIAEDNQASRGPLAILQSGWTQLAVLGLWLLCRYVLP